MKWWGWWWWREDETPHRVTVVKSFHKLKEIPEAPRMRLKETPVDPEPTQMALDFTAEPQQSTEPIPIEAWHAAYVSEEEWTRRHGRVQ